MTDITVIFLLRVQCYVTEEDSFGGTEYWAQPASYPAVQPGRIFSLDWFSLWFQGLQLMLTAIFVHEHEIHAVASACLKRGSLLLFSCSSICSPASSQLNCSLQFNNRRRFQQRLFATEQCF